MSQATFHLYDLKVEVIEGEKPFVCSHQLGDAFEVRGENLHFKTERPFSLYALAALLPLLNLSTNTTGWLPIISSLARIQIVEHGLKSVASEKVCTTDPPPP